MSFQLTPAALEREADRLQRMARRAELAPLEQTPRGLNPHAYASRLQRQARQCAALAFQMAGRA